MKYMYRVLGLNVRVPFPCPGLVLAPAKECHDVLLTEGAVPRELEGAVAAEGNGQAAPGRFLLRGGQQAGRFLVEDGSRITFERSPGAQLSVIVTHLLSSVIVAVLNQRGMLVLHANVALTPRGAIAITGESGAGKSTTLAALVAHGCDMLSDDITVLQFNSSQRIVALPGVRKMNLCEDAAVRLGHDIDFLERYPLRQTKVMVPLTADAVMEPVPLEAIFHLHRHAGDRVTRTQCIGAEKFSALQEFVYGPLFLSDHLGLFDLISALTKQVDIFRIGRPESRWCLDEIMEAISVG
ncbi:MAG: hypothetical protein A2X84_12510 [Desulfuromonadaceae bacterium GWC2_58_13]|nr:MAG: hypothetical protein A2X84_12510 [Desulfuromonadaceae bacterium GWC2_58_13]